MAAIGAAKGLELAARVAVAEERANPSGPVDAIFNRSQDRRWPASFAAIVAQRGQFEAYSNGSYKRISTNSPEYKAAYERLRALQAGEIKPAHNAVFFHAKGDGVHNVYDTKKVAHYDRPSVDPLGGAEDVYYDKVQGSPRETATMVGLASGGRGVQKVNAPQNSKGRFSADAPELYNRNSRGAKAKLDPAQVKVWQQALVDNGFMPAKLPNGKSSVDGKFGVLTTASTKDFQEAIGAKKDGIVGPETFQAMNAYASGEVEGGPLGAVSRPSEVPNIDAPISPDTGLGAPKDVPTLPPGAAAPGATLPPIMQPPGVKLAKSAELASPLGAPVEGPPQSTFPARPEPHMAPPGPMPRPGVPEIPPPHELPPSNAVKTFRVDGDGNPIAPVDEPVSTPGAALDGVGSDAPEVPTFHGVPIPAGAKASPGVNTGPIGGRAASTRSIAPQAEPPPGSVPASGPLPRLRPSGGPETVNVGEALTKSREFNAAPAETREIGGVAGTAAPAWMSVMMDTESDPNNPSFQRKWAQATADYHKALTQNDPVALQFQQTMTQHAKGPISDQNGLISSPENDDASAPYRNRATEDVSLSRTGMSGDEAAPNPAGFAPTRGFAEPNKTATIAPEGSGFGNAATKRDFNGGNSVTYPDPFSDPQGYLQAVMVNAMPSAKSVPYSVDYFSGGSGLTKPGGGFDQTRAFPSQTEASPETFTPRSSLGEVLATAGAGAPGSMLSADALSPASRGVEAGGAANAAETFAAANAMQNAQSAGITPSSTSGGSNAAGSAAAGGLGAALTGFDGFGGGGTPADANTGGTFNGVSAGGSLQGANVGAALAALNAQLQQQAAAQGYNPNNPNMVNAPF